MGENGRTFGKACDPAVLGDATDHPVKAVVDVALRGVAGVDLG